MPHEIARALETNPEKPSAAIRRTEDAGDRKQGKVLTPGLFSGLRGSSPENLRRRLAGDLNNIVLKAIRKEPRERYSSADQLSEDIRRHLEGLPVLARKGTVAYRGRKYVLRDKVGVAAAALIFLSFFTGMALTSRAVRERVTNLFAFRHTLTDKDTVVLADFTNTTGDTVFDDTLKTALDVSLQQSPFLHALSDSEVAKTLQLMTRSTGTKLTPDVAREVCQRAGSQGVHCRGNCDSRE